MKEFLSMLSSHNGDKIFIYHPTYEGKSKIFLLYDMVPIIKNARNNLLRSKKFDNPSFKFDKLRDEIVVSSGCIEGGLLHWLHGEDVKLGAHLKKAR